MRIRTAIATSLFLALSVCLYGQGNSQSNSRGILYASDFSAWSLPPSTTGPANGTLTYPSAVCTASSNGYSFIAAKVGRPLLISDNTPSLTETVTPTAVSINGSSCTISAPMAHQHYNYTVSSGTYGLQEAIDYASAKGWPSAVVELTPAWANLGGTTAMVTAATGSTAVGILDTRTTPVQSYSWSGSSYVLNAAGSGSGTVTASPQFQIPYYSTAGTSNAVKGDSGITTDGNGNLTARSVNAVISTDRYSSGSATGGIAEAIAACPLISSGCKVQIGGNISIASPQTITPAAGAVLTLDFNGFTVTCTNTTGVCLTINLASVGRHNFIMKDATIDGAGAGAGTTGLELENGVDGDLRTIRVQNFYQTGSQGVVLNNIEDFHGVIRSEQNFSGVLYENSSNNNQLILYLNDGGATAHNTVPGASSALTGIALSIQGSAGNSIWGLVQANTGTQTVLLGQDTGRNNFYGVWFEDNGDSTSASKLVTFQSAVGHYILNTVFEGCNFFGGTLGASGSIFSAAVPSTVLYVLMEGNYSNGYGTFADSTLTGTTIFTGINENETVTGAQAFYNSNIDNSGNYISTRSLTGDGSKTAPSWSFNANQGYGMYFRSGVLEMALSSTPNFQFSANGMIVGTSTNQFVGFAPGEVDTTLVDTSLNRISPGVLGVGQSATNKNDGVLQLAALDSTGTAFSVTGCGTTTGLVGGSTAGKFVAGQAACTPVITMGGVTATNGFSCWMNDQTTSAVKFQQTGYTTTTATFTATGTLGATDTITFGCVEF